MSILNRQKIRPDVLKVMEDFLKVNAQGLFKYFKDHEDSGIEFKPLWKKLMKANKQFFKKEKSQYELSKLLTMEEKIFLAKAFRFAFNFVGDIEQKNNPILEGVSVESINAGGVPAEWQIVPEAAEDKVILYFHGGGYIMGSPNTGRLLTTTLGHETKMRVLSLDYRLGPENTYPAPLEDSVNAYKWLLDSGYEPEKIIISGDSAGGHLTLITLIKLREEGISLPAGAFLISPFLDVTTSGETFFKNAETDPVLSDLGIFWWAPSTFKDLDPSDNRISPVFADLKALPPLLVHASTSEILYSDSVRMVEKAKAAGVDVTLQIWDDMPHVFQQFGLNKLPEAKESIDKFAEFVQKVIS